MSDETAASDANEFLSSCNDNEWPRTTPVIKLKSGTCHSHLRLVRPNEPILDTSEVKDFVDFGHDRP